MINVLLRVFQLVKSRPGIQIHVACLQSWLFYRLNLLIYLQLGEILVRELSEGTHLLRSSTKDTKGQIRFFLEILRLDQRFLAIFKDAPTVKD